MTTETKITCDRCGITKGEDKGKDLGFWHQLFFTESGTAEGLRTAMHKAPPHDLCWTCYVVVRRAVEYSCLDLKEAYRRKITE